MGATAFQKHKSDLYRGVLRYPYCMQQPVNYFLKQKHHYQIRRLQVRSSIICLTSFKRFIKIVGLHLAVITFFFLATRAFTQALI